MASNENNTLDTKIGINVVDTKKSLRITYSFATLAWIFFLTSASKQSSSSFVALLLSGRSILLFASFALLLLTWSGKRLQHSIPYFFAASMIVQSIFSCFEPEDAVEFYKFISYFLLLNCLSFNGYFSDWLKKFALPTVATLSVPLFFKSEHIFGGISQIVFSFSETISLLFISGIILLIGSKKFAALVENIQLKEKFLQNEKISHNSVKIELDEAKKLLILAAKNEAIASTTSALAHDVRKPFSMLKMVLNSILNAATPLEAQEIARGSLPEIAQSLVTVDGMIQDVMQIGSNSKPNLEIASPDTVIENALNEVFRIFPDATVIVEYDLHHKHSIFIDTLRVARVFSNIICNALQAMDAKGTIWIKTAEKADFLEFRLGNVGSCIPAENLPKLFEAFFTSDKKGGTGLGLAIAQKVVIEHGGSIRCESERNSKCPSGYVEFIFTLPLAAELCEVRTQNLPKTASEVHAQFASMKPKNAETASAEEIALEIELSKKIEGMGSHLPSLLIVDDEAVYRNSLANLLHQGQLPFGQIPVLFSKNYDEALENCKAHNPFLVIQDIDLGANSKNGIATIIELKRMGFMGRICVHSNRFLFGDQKEAFDAGADSVMPKPMSRIQLLKIILQALSELTGSHQTPLSTSSENPIEKLATTPQIKLAFLDDTKTFTMIWKMNLKNSLNIETFSKTTQFLERATSEPDFLSSFDVIVTDYHFADGDPHTGKTFAAEVRKMGFTKPIMLATNGDFTADELKPDLNGCVGKEVPTLEQVEGWLRS